MCTRSGTDSLVEKARAFGAEVVVGVGGGSTIDSAKAVSHELGSLPLVVAPTVASSDAPCSALAVQHTPDHGLDRFLLLKRSPDVVLVDSQVIVQAPVRFFVSGMGDALATWFEALTCTKSSAKNTPGGVSTAAALSLARLCYDTLMEYGVSAKLAVERQALTPAVERVVEANTLLSGLGFESSGLAAAHGINDGLAILEEAHGALHGELVAFGTITQLVMECHPQAEIDRVIDFCKAVGLPVTLKQLGITDTSSAHLRKAAEEACKEKMTTHNTYFQGDSRVNCRGSAGSECIGRTPARGLSARGWNGFATGRKNDWRAGAGARARDKKGDLEQDMAEVMAAKAAEIKLVIDGVEAVASPEMTILEVAEKQGVAIPTLCHVHGLVPFGGCRLCVVEIEGVSRLTGACHTPAVNGMVVRTHSSKVLRARRVILELLMAGHTGPCVTDTGARSCALHQMAADVALGPPRFPVHTPRYSPVEDVSPYVRRDLSALHPVQPMCTGLF